MYTYDPNNPKHIIFHEGLTQLTSDMVSDLTIEEVTLPSTLKTIEKMAFFSCDKLAKVHMQDGLEFIGERAFRGCYALKSLHMPDTVVSLGEFIMPPNIELVHLSRALESLPRGLFHDCARIHSLRIPDNVKSIEPFVFFRCTSLVDVSFSKSLEKIEQFAFAYCESLVNLPFLQNVSQIGSSAFYRCTKLRALIIENEDCHIDYFALDGCVALDLLVLPNPLPLLNVFDPMFAANERSMHVTVCTIHSFKTWIDRMKLTNSGYSNRDLAMLYNLSRRTDYVCSWSIMRARHPDILMEDLMRITPVAKRNLVFPHNMLSHYPASHFPQIDLRMLHLFGKDEKIRQLPHFNGFYTIATYAALLDESSKVILFPKVPLDNATAVESTSSSVLNLAHEKSTAANDASFTQASSLDNSKESTKQKDDKPITSQGSNAKTPSLFNASTSNTIVRERSTKLPANDTISKPRRK